MDPEQDGADELAGEQPGSSQFPDVAVIGSGPWDLGPAPGAGRFIGGGFP
jgi:hypothetical protein